jgi:rod shape-determining protein MreC
VYRKQIRRRRAVLGLLVVASLILLTASFGDRSSGPVHGVQRGIATVLGPFQEVADRALKPARDTVNWFRDTFDAKGENERLKDELEELRTRLALSETAINQNRQLRRLVELGPDGGVAGYKAVSATVVGRSPSVWYSSVTVNAGSSDGVRVDQPVVNGDGLVGRVADTTPLTAQVTLISDHTSAVSGLVVPDGISGVVEPQVGNPQDLLLDFIERDSRVREGRTVVTAGWSSGEIGSLFPAGIPIGRVTDANLEEQQTSQRVHVTPFVDFKRLEFVRILTGRKR